VKRESVDSSEPDDGGSGSDLAGELSAAAEPGGASRVRSDSKSSATFESRFDNSSSLSGVFRPCEAEAAVSARHLRAPAGRHCRKQTQDPSISRCPPLLGERSSRGSSAFGATAAAEHACISSPGLFDQQLQRACPGNPLRPLGRCGQGHRSARGASRSVGGCAPRRLPLPKLL
jgi:hypothetical protein